VSEEKKSDKVRYEYVHGETFRELQKKKKKKKSKRKIKHFKAKNENGRQRKNYINLMINN
jgi:hypothetical protein